MTTTDFAISPRAWRSGTARNAPWTASTSPFRTARSTGCRPNGAGKTTAVRIFATLIRPNGGRAMVGGFDVVGRPLDVRRSIGLTGQYAAVDEILTGRQNLEMFGRLFHLGAKGASGRRSCSSSSTW